MKTKYNPLTSPLAGDIFVFLVIEGPTDYEALAKQFGKSRVVIVEIVSAMESSVFVKIVKPENTRKVNIEVDYKSFAKIVEEYFLFYLDDPRTGEDTNTAPAPHGVKVLFKELNDFFSTRVSIEIIKTLSSFVVNTHMPMTCMEFINFLNIELVRLSFPTNLNVKNSEYGALRAFSKFLKKHRKKYGAETVQTEVNRVVKKHFSNLIKKEESGQELAPIPCPYCKTTNSADAAICKNLVCSRPLTMEGITQDREQKAEAMRQMMHGEITEAIAAYLRPLGVKALAEMTKNQKRLTKEG